MDILCTRIIEAGPPHERIALLEELTRALEGEIGNPDAPGGDLHAFHMAHFKDHAEERLVVQKVTVSTGMLLFANTLRDTLRREEAAWREGEHATIASLVPGWVEAGWIPEWGEPLLFMSASRLTAVLRAMQKVWRTERLKPPEAARLLRWAQCRAALLITFPYDAETFDEGAYRQKYGETGLYLASMALVFDLYALISSMQFDLWNHARIAPYPGEGVPTVAPRPLDETRAWRFMDGLMGKVQGDSLCTTFQKAFIESAVRVGDDLLFARRRPSAIAPTHMDLISECHGVDYSRETHAKADVRLVDVYREPEYADLIWLIVVDYYVRQKTHYPWMELHLVHRLGGTAPWEGEAYPRVVHLPVENTFAVQYGPTAVVRYGSALQAILRWMEAAPDSVMHGGTRYDLGEIIGEFI